MIPLLIALAVMIAVFAVVAATTVIDRRTPASLAKREKGSRLATDERRRRPF